MRPGWTAQSINQSIGQVSSSSQSVRGEIKACRGGPRRFGWTVLDFVVARAEGWAETDRALWCPAESIARRSAVLKASSVATSGVSYSVQVRRAEPEQRDHCRALSTTLLRFSVTHVPARRCSRSGGSNLRADGRISPTRSLVQLLSNMHSCLLLIHKRGGPVQQQPGGWGGGW